MKTFLKILCGIAVVALAVVGANALFVQAGIETPLEGMVENATAGAANAALDATGVKTKAQEVLEANAGRIAEETGLPVSAVNAMIEDVDIESWQVAPLPEGAVATGSQTVDYEGVSATVTTYDDPSIVTVNVGSTDVTLAVPESAQGYVKYLGHL